MTAADIFDDDEDGDFFLNDMSGEYGGEVTYSTI